MEKSSNIQVISPNVKYTDDYIYADYEYEETLVTKKDNELLVSVFKKCSSSVNLPSILKISIRFISILIV